MKEITRSLLRSCLPSRPRDAHKGSFGRVLVVAGSRTMSGAGFLCAKSALLAGAGLVFWALPQSMQSAFAAALPEVITLPLPETPQGELSLEGLPQLETFIRLRNPSLAVVGPGMGDSPLLPVLLQQLSLPLVADADALNALALQPNWAQTWNRARACVFTPHPGEMARLLKEKADPSDEARLRQVQTLCRLTGGVSLLKGAGTLVCAQTDGEMQVWRNTTGGPALAKAGSGDVLSGVIAGLWAQLGTAEGFDEKSALKAALCGVYLHGLAGDLAARQRTDYGVLARDTATSVPLALKEVLQETQEKESL